MKKFFKFLLICVLVCVITAGGVVGFNAIKNHRHAALAEGDPILNNIIDVLPQTEYLSGNLLVSVDGRTATGVVRVTQNPSFRFSVKMDLSAFGAPSSVEVRLVDNCVYLLSGTLAFKLDLGTAKASTETIIKFINNHFSSLPQINFGATDSDDVLNVLGLSGGIDGFDTSLLENFKDAIVTRKTKNGYSLNFSLKGALTFGAKFDTGYSLLSFSTNTFKLGGKRVKLSFSATQESNIRIYSPSVISGGSRADIVSDDDLSGLLTAAEKTFNGAAKFSGLIKLKMPAVGEVRIPVFVKQMRGGVAVLLTNLPTAIYTNTKVFTTAKIHPHLRHYAALFIKGDTIFYNRQIDYFVKNKGDERRVETLATGSIKLNDFLGNTKNTINMLTPILGVGKTVTGAVNFFGTTRNTPSIDTMVRSAKISAKDLGAQKVLSLNIDLSRLTGNRDFGAIDAGVTTTQNGIYSFSASAKIGQKFEISLSLSKTNNFGKTAFSNKTHAVTIDIENLLNSLV